MKKGVPALKINDDARVKGLRCATKRKGAVDKLARG